jgi:hypothetical protein
MIYHLLFEWLKTERGLKMLNKFEVDTDKKNLRKYLHINFYILTLFLLISPFLLSGCDVLESDAPASTFEYDFTQSDHDWEAFISNYSNADLQQLDFTADYTGLPSPLPSSDNAHFIQAENHPEGFKMLYRKQIDGLEPFTPYQIRYTIRFATDVPSGCDEIGEPAGEDVRVLARSHVLKPDTTDIQGFDFQNVLNIQHLENPQTWLNESTIGDITNTRECGESRQFEMKEIRTSSGFDSITADSNGRAWLMFGTRTGYQGDTILYYTYFKAEFKQITSLANNQ